MLDKGKWDAKLEALLHKQRLLDVDDHIVDSVCAPGGVLLGYDRDQVESSASALDKGCCCVFSSRRLYLPQLKMTVDLERVWRVECWGTDLAVVFSAGEQVTAVCLEACLAPEGPATSAQVAAFADRLLAQRDRRIAELPADTRQRREDTSADLERRGILEAALAELIPHPRTRVGAWLRALLLGDADEMARYRRGTGWSTEETPVLQAAFVLQVRRYFGAGFDANAVAVLRSSIAERLAEKGRQLDLGPIEAMVRSALSEPGSHDRPSGQRLQLVGVVAGSIARDLQMSSHAIWLLVIRSEQMALEHGFSPPPVED